MPRPYLSADAASGANDALPDAALEVLGRRGDKRLYIDPRKRLESSNKGATQMAQNVLARATASLGGDPRTPAGNLLMPPPPPQDTPVTHHDPEMRVAMLRVSVLMEQIAGGLGFDVSNLPAAPAPAQPAPAPPSAQTPFESAGRMGPASGTRDVQGAAQGDPEGDADSSEDEGAGLDADANRDGGDDSGDDGDVDAGGDGDNTPPSPPSPGEIVATQRRASSRAKKAPRRSL